MTVTLDETLLPMLDRVTVVLADYDAVTQQKVLALTTVRHAMRARPRSFRCGLYAQTRHAADRRNRRRTIMSDDNDKLAQLLQQSLQNLASQKAVSTPWSRRRALSALWRSDRDLSRQRRQEPDALLRALRDGGGRAGE
jgi:hypothetical protein